MKAIKIMPAKNDSKQPSNPTTPAAAPLVPTKEAVLGELMRLGFANMNDYIRIEGGQTHVDLENLTRDQAAAIVEVTVTTKAQRNKDGEGEVEITDIRFKLADKRQALVELGKHLGLFSEPKAPPPEAETPDFSDPKARLELARQILFVIEDAKQMARRAAE
jgi:hypothetical protein